MKKVTFKQPYTPYAPGDVTAIDDKLAAQLIEDGVCEAYKPAKAEEPEQKSKDAPAVDKMVEGAPVKK